MSKAPRFLLVLTTAKPGELPAIYLRDETRFPEPGSGDTGRNTADLAKARAWIYPPGVRRFLKRHPHLTGYRRIKVPADAMEGAIAADAKAGQGAGGPLPGSTGPAAGREKIGPEPGAGRLRRSKPATARRTKIDPNKRTKRAARKTAMRALRTKFGKPGARKVNRRRKVA